ncbi:MAG: hypothetical protein EAX86_02885 [Candidatus Heimdallarchaeota archaeon]|nr:hypothetical protein [Candidatus Heimdallarchaeota archaeon]
MSRKNPKLVFIQNIAEQERRLEREISSEAKSIVQNLQRNPKMHYSLTEIEALIETFKRKMQSFNKEAHTEFSKIGLKGVDNIEELDSSGAIVVTHDELDQLKNEIDEWRRRAAEIEPIQLQLDDLQIQLQEKEGIIAKLQNQSGISSDKVEDQLENINRLQEELDQALREAKQARHDREKMDAEFETVGNALVSTRLEVEELQSVLGDRDMEIENLKAEVQVLTSSAEDNIKLKEANEKLRLEIESIREENLQVINIQKEKFKEDLNSLKSQLKQLNTDMSNLINVNDELSERIKQLEEENEDLLLDSAETSQQAVTLREELDDTKKVLERKEDEVRELSLKVEAREKGSQDLTEYVASLKEEKLAIQKEIEDFKRELSRIKQQNSDLSAEIEKLSLQQKEHEEISENLKREKRSIQMQLEDKTKSLMGKDERITSLEEDRNQLRDELANLNISFEKQKSIITDFENQLQLKNRELEESRKDLELFRQRQTEIAKEATESIAFQSQIERERDDFATQIQSLQSHLDNSNAENKRLEKRLKEVETALNDKNNVMNLLEKEKMRLESKSENLQSAVETLKINLAKNPKYALLFVLQEVQQASITELAKSVAIQLVFAARLVKELEEEGWLTFDEDTGKVTLTKVLIEI